MPSASFAKPPSSNPFSNGTPFMSNTQILASFAANLEFEQIPKEVVDRTEDLFLDWFGSALAGRGARPVETIQKQAFDFGPQSGPCEVLISRRSTSPLFAA